MSGLCIMGAGAFGTALAIALSQEREVTLWGRDPATMQALSSSRRNDRRLPGVTLPDSIHATADTAALSDAATVLIALPMQQLSASLMAQRAALDGKVLVACAKGVDLTTGQGATALIRAACPSAVAAILTGPSFATDIARGLPTALTLGCADDGPAQTVQQELSNATIRIYRTSDVVGAELGGALKNVVAIAAGMVMGAGLGDSARAALMTRGYAEMVRLAVALGARAETLAGLSGFGDLVLTCTSDLSRNFRFGHALGAGRQPEAGVTVEGAATAEAVTRLAVQHGIDMPVSAMVAAVIRQDVTLNDAMTALLSRPLKEE